MAMRLSDDFITKAVEMTPVELSERKEIAILLLELEVEKGNISEDNLMDSCMKHGDYRAFGNYIVKIAPNDPHAAQIIIEK